MAIRLNELKFKVHQSQHAASCHNDWQLLADSVEKVAPVTGLRQNLFIGRRGITQHDGTVIEWAGATVLLVQP
jgi:hypothetical protein